MSGYRFEIYAENLSKADPIPRGRDLKYKCLACGDMLHSIPDDNGGCSCDNIFIDKDYFRIVIKDYSNFQILRRIRQL